MDSLAALIWFLFDLDAKAHPAPPIPHTLKELIQSRCRTPVEQKNTAHFLQASEECAKMAENDCVKDCEERKEDHV